MRKLLSLLFIFTFILSFSQEKNKQYKITSVAFYNIENLFDTIGDPDTNKILQEEFTPKGSKNWTSAKYKQKLENIASVIAKVGVDKAKMPPALIGISEIENRKVLEDLVMQKSLKQFNYKIAHYNSPDKRGVDVALLYRDDAFKLIDSKSFTLVIPENPDFYTRAQLLVKGTIDDDTLFVIVNHWPSRRGGEKRSSPMRKAAARLSKSIVDSILSYNKDAKVIVMGDLNDDPSNASVKTYLKAKPEKDIADDEMYNTMYKLFSKGIGSLAYRDNWNLFDQIIISKGLLGEYSEGYNFYQAHVYNKAYLKQESGKYQGYPLRTFTTGGEIGYSDHFPTYIFLLKEIK
jgi:hypothetical protein